MEIVRKPLVRLIPALYLQVITQKKFHKAWEGKRGEEIRGQTLAILKCSGRTRAHGVKPDAQAFQGRTYGTPVEVKPNYKTDVDCEPTE